MHNLDVWILQLNSLGEARICSIKISDVKIHQLCGGSHGDESLNALLRDMFTPGEREMLQLRAFLRQHFKGPIIDQGPLKVCMCQFGTACDELLDVNSTETFLVSNINVSKLVTVISYEADAPAS